MSSVEQYTYWSVTINNPDDNDMLIVQNPNPKYIREFIWTPEEGKDGTNHIQAWLRLQRNQTLTFVKKLYPRAHLKPCKKDDYNEHTHSYAQKNDDTTRGQHTISLNDPLMTIEQMIVKVVLHMIANYSEVIELDDAMKMSQHDLVLEDYRNAKFFVSSTYKQMWKEYGHDMYKNIFTAKEKQDASCPVNCSASQAPLDSDGS